MIHHTTTKFWTQLYKLPKEIQKKARLDFKKFKDDPNYPSLRFKQLKPISSKRWSVSIGEHYRAIAEKTDDGYLWGWIGTHEEYNKLIKR